MTKGQIIEFLQDFEDDDVLLIGENLTHLYQLNPRKICGGLQHGMAYFCVKEPNHTGLCYCSCKDVEFKPDKMSFEEFMSVDYDDDE
jgi:hypothetical protein